MGLALMGLLLVFSSLRLTDIVAGQGDLLWGFLPKWGVVVQPLGFVLFITAVFAETNRNPFDLPEGESEIVAGYHLEYSSLKFALFFMAEYCPHGRGRGADRDPLLRRLPDPLAAAPGARGPRGPAADPQAAAAWRWSRWLHRAALPAPRRSGRRASSAMPGTASRCWALLFWLVLAAGRGRRPAAAALDHRAGGRRRWSRPCSRSAAFVAKVVFFAWLFIWVRWTLPRFRYDQLMHLGWKVMLPAGAGQPRRHRRGDGARLTDAGPGRSDTLHPTRSDMSFEGLPQGTREQAAQLPRVDLPVGDRARAGRDHAATWCATSSTPATCRPCSTRRRSASTATASAGGTA